jgi:hypothetical protein
MKRSAQYLIPLIYETFNSQIQETNHRRWNVHNMYVQGGTLTSERSVLDKHPMIPTPLRHCATGLYPLNSAFFDQYHHSNKSAGLRGGLNAQLRCLRCRRGRVLRF